MLKFSEQNWSIIKNGFLMLASVLQLNSHLIMHDYLQVHTMQALKIPMFTGIS